MWRLTVTDEAALRRSLRADFNRLAQVDEPGWNRNSHYHEWILGQLPAHPARLLEIGCGRGEFAGLLAQRAEFVLAIDLSEAMLSAAARDTSHVPKISFLQADFMDLPLPDDYFDCVVSIATLHHLNLTNTLPRIARLLKPGGVLVVLDLYKPANLMDWIVACLAYPCSLMLQFHFTGRWRESFEARKAWDDHSRHDRLVTFCNIRDVYGAAMPGAVVRRHLLFRYSARWIKPGHHKSR